MRLYIVSTWLWKIWWPRWCHMFNVTHRNDFVTQKVSRHRSFSVWTRAWTRLVVDTLRGNMSVEPKHRKLWDKLYTDKSPHEKICMRTRPCKFMLMKVYYETHSCACSHTKRRLSVHFLTYKVMPMRNFKHIISHLVCHIIFHRCSRNKVQHHNFLTYEPFSLCNFWLTRTSPCANCHIGGRVCVQLTT